jgi:hypothetical protein
MTVALVFMGVTSMWIMWACVYMHQMHPLMYPEMKGTSSNA